jgi:hypothetical protein
MNHSINGDKSELKTLSVSPSFVNSDHECFYASTKLVDNDEISEHIYENVPKKRKSLSELMNGLRSKTRELSLTKYARKLKPKMIEHKKNATSDEFCDDEEFLIDEMSSYTSCHEENIYENLDFNDTQSEKEIELENYSLKSWLHSLSLDVEDYDDGSVMMSKCIPSKHKNVSWCNDGEVTHSESELDKFKLDILKKCFYGIWKCESENEILSNLYVFLNDIFATYFRKSRVVVNTEVNNNSYDTLCRSIDKKKTVQKLETFILSPTLNRLTITYNKSLKFSLALESSQFFGAGINSILKFSRLVVCKNRRRFEVTSRKDLRNFLGTLKLVLENSVHQKAIKETDDVKSTSEENIYEPIWDCTNNINRYESLYDIVGDKTICDDEDWIIDAEFRYLPKQPISSKENMYRTIQIIHRVNNNSTESTSQLAKNDAPSLSSVDVIQNKDSLVDFYKLDSVRAWKELLRSPFCCEDEEEFVRKIWAFTVRVNNQFVLRFY